MWNTTFPSRPDRRAHGFTLIELLVVMVIIGIVASILIGFFVSGFRKTQLRDGAVQLLTDMRQVRSQAQRTSMGGSVALTSTTPSTPLKTYATYLGNGTATPTKTDRTLSDPIRVAPYTSGAAYATLAYSAPYGDVTATGVVWVVSSSVISDKLYVKAVGVTGKVILSATP